MITNLCDILASYIQSNYPAKDQKLIANELSQIESLKSVDLLETTSVDKSISYDEIQNKLTKLNEKESIRKKKGVYYTPDDLVEFIVVNSVKQFYNQLSPDNISDVSLNTIDALNFATKTSVFDPTCGTGVFLLYALDLKFQLLKSQNVDLSRNTVHKTIATLYGNDINAISTTITKVRMILLVVEYFGISYIKGISKLLKQNFTNNDFITNPPSETYDIIIGNPPYVESSKYHGELTEKFGNIYANTLLNAARMLSDEGAFGFVIPLSYVATPRMKAIRTALFQIMPEQYILNYSDRPDCLFISVHQKLCIVIAQKSNKPREIYTSAYQYWYKEERKHLFDNIEMIGNDFSNDKFIPKLGNDLDQDIYQKVSLHSTEIVNEINVKTLKQLLSSEEGNNTIYLNMRSTFWMKAFLHPKTGGEYKPFKCDDVESVSLAMCLLNSSLFWWHWVCISDCWHITNKELETFILPTKKIDYDLVKKLAIQLENKLEATKKYVGTKQVDYEYKHKQCIEEIHAIDDYINAVYGLNKEESDYIKTFAYKYRMGEKI